MYKGKPSEGIEFYELLYSSEEFCKELGKVALAAGKLESQLIRYFEKREITEISKRATLGKLIASAKKHKLLTDLLDALETLCFQRNYLTHNIYALFSELVEETVLQRTNLLDSDVVSFTERAWELQSDLLKLAEIVAKEK